MRKENFGTLNLTRGVREEGLGPGTPNLTMGSQEGGLISATLNLTRGVREKAWGLALPILLWVVRKEA